MSLEVYSDKDRWNRGVELAYAAEEFEKRLQIEGQIPVHEIKDRLVEPYVNRWDKTGFYHPDRYQLFSAEVEKALRPTEIRGEGDQAFWVVPKEELLESLRSLVGKLIGPESNVQNPYTELKPTAK